MPGVIGQPVKATWTSGTAKVTLHEAKWANTMDLNHRNLPFAPILMFDVSYEVISGTISLESTRWLAVEAGGRYLIPKPPLADSSLTWMAQDRTLAAGQTTRGWITINLSREPIDLWLTEVPPYSRLVTYANLIPTSSTTATTP